MSYHKGHWYDKASLGNNTGWKLAFMTYPERHIERYTNGENETLTRVWMPGIGWRDHYENEKTGEVKDSIDYQFQKG